MRRPAFYLHDHRILAYIPCWAATAATTTRRQDAVASSHQATVSPGNTTATADGYDDMRWCDAANPAWSTTATIMNLHHLMYASPLCMHFLVFYLILRNWISRTNAIWQYNPCIPWRPRCIHRPSKSWSVIGADIGACSLAQAWRREQLSRTAGTTVVLTDVQSLEQTVIGDMYIAIACMRFTLF